MPAGIVAIVQARMSSRRLPGKVLRMLGDRPIIGHIIDRVRRSSLLDGVVIATSTEPSDDPLAQFCADCDIPCVRGDLQDVASRYALAMDSCPADIYVRLCGDSPVMDPEVIDRVVLCYRDKRPSLATNVFPRTYPAGLSVEAIDPTVFRCARASFSTQAHREHVTRYFYEHVNQYRISNVVNTPSMNDLDLSVNTPEQWAVMERLCRQFGGRWASVGWREVAAAMKMELDANC